MGMDADQTPARTQGLHQRRHYFRSLELDARPRAIGLRSDHQIIVRRDPSRSWQNWIEQERVILAMQRQDDGPDVHWVSAGFADARPPVLRQKTLEVADLLGEAMRGVAGQSDIFPDQALGRGRRTRGQPRRFRVKKIGQNEDGGRVLEESVGDLVQGQPYVLVADLLADDIERHCREARVHSPHHTRKHRAVAHAGVEHPNRGRGWMDIAEFERYPMGDVGLLAACRNEQQIFLPIVEEAEAGRLDVGFRLAEKTVPGRRPDRRNRRRAAVLRNIRANFIEGAGRNLGAVAQTGDQLSVIDDASPERQFGRARFAAIIPDFPKNTFGSRRFGLTLTQLNLHRRSPRFQPWRQSDARQIRRSTTIGVGERSGRLPIHRRGEGSRRRARECLASRALSPSTALFRVAGRARCLAIGKGLSLHRPKVGVVADKGKRLPNV